MPFGNRAATMQSTTHVSTFPSIFTAGVHHYFSSPSYFNGLTDSFAGTFHPLDKYLHKVISHISVIHLPATHSLNVLAL